MLRVFLSLNILKVGGLGLSYLAIVYLNRSHGSEALGRYMFVLNSVITVGTLTTMGLPTVVQRLGARFGAEQIGPATRMLLNRHWLTMIAIAGLASLAILRLDENQVLTLKSILELTLASLGFALTLILIETTRISKGPLTAEVQRNLLRPSLTLALILAGTGVTNAVVMSVLLAFAMTIAIMFWKYSNPIHQSVNDTTSIRQYVSGRSRDLRILILLDAMSLVFSTMDVVLFGILFDYEETGVYAAASRYAMLINVALLAGNAQMVIFVARVAENGIDDIKSLTQMRNQVKLVRLSATGLFVLLLIGMPIYAWVISIPITELWPYFGVVALSFWLQALLGPSNMFMMHSHQVSNLIGYSCVGLGLFAVTATSLHYFGISWAVPMGAAVGSNAVKFLSWNQIRRSHGFMI